MYVTHKKALSDQQASSSPRVFFPALEAHPGMVVILLSFNRTNAAHLLTLPGSVDSGGLALGHIVRYAECQKTPEFPALEELDQGIRA